MVGNIPGGNFLGGNFRGGGRDFPEGSLMGSDFLGGGRGIFPRGILLEAILISNLAESVIMTNRLRVRLHVTERKPIPG